MNMEAGEGGKILNLGVAKKPTHVAFRSIADRGLNLGFPYAYLTVSGGYLFSLMTLTKHRRVHTRFDKKLGIYKLRLKYQCSIQSAVW